MSSPQHASFFHRKFRSAQNDPSGKLAKSKTHRPSISSSSGRPSIDIEELGYDLYPTNTRSTFIPKPPPAEPPVLQTLHKRSPFGAILSRTLPNYSGHYPVGVCDVEVPIERQRFGQFKHKSMPHAEAGLTIDTVLFTLFYPSEATQTNNKVVWFPRLRQTIDGFLLMSNRTPNWLYRTVTYPAAAAAIYGTTFPAIENAHLKQPPPGTKWPVIIFSHGVGCSRLMYSAFCGEMASRGYIVAAIEHRDGTGPSSRITDSNGEMRILDWLDWRDLYWPDSKQPENDTTLRHVQLEVRLAETLGVIKTLEKIASGTPVGQTTLTQASTTFDWAAWASCVSMHKPIMAGHSFGGSLGIAAATDSRFHFGRVIVFDPAVQRLFPWKGTIRSKFLAINSEEFARGDEMSLLVDMLPRIARASVFLIPGSTHPSFSDVFLILPDYINRLTGLNINADKVIEMMIQLVDSFLDGKVEEAGKHHTVREVSSHEELKAWAKGVTLKDVKKSMAKKGLGRAGSLVVYRNGD
ncbi:platelet-activating factor acetylhydrolase, isoform II-domain-containing protein, partial [Abortiporus biennis]